MPSLYQLDIVRSLMDTTHSLCYKKMCRSKFGRAIKEGLINEFIDVDLQLYIIAFWLANTVSVVSKKMFA